MVRGARGQNTIGQWQRYGRTVGPAAAQGQVLFLYIRVTLKTPRRHETVGRTKRDTGQRGATQTRPEDPGTGL